MCCGGDTIFWLLGVFWNEKRCHLGVATDGAKGETEREKEGEKERERAT